MARVRVSTTVDRDLLARARQLHVGPTDASLLEAALEALLREHREAEIDRQYARGYAEQPIQTHDEWGDVEAFLDAPGKL